MFDLIETILDISSWILAGAFLGLIALGGVYTYNASARPPLPNLTIEPVRNEQNTSRQDEKTFRPLEQFYLVQRYSEMTEEPDTPTSPDSNTETSPAPGPEQPASTGEITESELPYKLLGTVTGSPRFQYARVKSLEDRKSRTLKVGEAWGALTIEEIHDNKILIRNNNTNRIEMLSLRPESSRGGSRP